MMRPRCTARPRAGFTMIEVLMVIIIIGILLAVAIPRFPVTATRVDGAVRVTRAALQSAQRGAVARQASVVVGIDTAAHRLRIHDDTDADGVVDAGERVRSEPLQEGVRFAAPPAGVNGAGADAVVGTALRERDGLPTVTFRRDGSASSDLELYLSPRTGDATGWRAVVVSPSTGRVDAFRRSGDTWRRMRP